MKTSRFTDSQVSWVGNITPVQKKQLLLNVA